MTQQQRKLFITAAVAAPIIHIASGIPWFLSAAISLLGEAGRSLLSKRKKRGENWLENVVFLLLLGEGMGQMSSCWQGQKDIKWVMFILLILAVLLAAKGEAAAAGGGILLWWFAAFLLGSVYLSAVPQFSAANLIPDNGKIPWNQCGALLSVLIVPGLWTREEGRKEMPRTFLMLFPVLTAAAVQGVLGIRGAMEEAAPFYELSRSIRLYGIFDRMEGLAWMGLMLGTFLYLTFLSLGYLQNEKARRKEYGVLAVVLGGALLAAGAGTIWQLSLPAMGFLLFQGRMGRKKEIEKERKEN